MRWIKPADLGLMLGVLAAQSAPFVLGEQSPGDDPWTLTGYLPVVGTVAALVFRRALPIAALLIAEVSIALYDIAGGGPAQPIWYAALVCMFSLGMYAKRSHQIAAIAITVAGLLPTVGSVTTAVRELLMWSAAFVLGVAMRARQELTERAAELAAEQERTRIGRDLHDILGHAVSLMTVQAEAGAAVARKDPAKAEAALEAIADAGRAAMVQLRGTVSALRGAPREPQPGLAELSELIARSANEGLAVSLAEHGMARPVNASTELAAYRLVQEALTNVVRHAGATEAKVSVTYAPETLRVKVTDNGRGGDLVRAGHGLTGMRERVTAAGGILRYGPGTDGLGFQVEAVFS